MNAPVDRNRWKLADDHFAVSFVVDDIPGLFFQHVLVEPGTKAMIVDDGEYLGEVPPGSYTLQTFADKLKFWKKKQATIVLTRQEDFPLQIPSNRVANTKPLLVSTKENLSVAASIRVAVQLDDVAMFLRNLKGAKEVYSVIDLERHLRPLLMQSLWESVGNFSITELTSPQAREKMDAAMEHALSVSLKRYGIRFVQVQLVTLRHKQYEFHCQKSGQSWIREKELEQLEKENDLDVLAANMEVDHQESLLAVKKRRIVLQNELMEAIRSKEFDKITDKEELAVFLQQRDKAKLLRREEITELVEGYHNRRQDRTEARQHLLATLQLQRRYEQEALRQDLGHALRLKRLDHEIELTKQSESKDNLRWRQQVEKERRETEHRYQQHDEKLKQQRIWLLRQSQQRREDQWDDLIHEQRVQQQDDEMLFARTQREQRLAILKAELESDLEVRRLEIEKRRKEQELELAAKEGENQLQRLAAVQELNQQSSQRQLELNQQQQKLDAELADLSADKAHLREVAKLQALNEVSSDVLIATSKERQSEALADLKKHQASQQTAVNQQVTASKIAEERSKLQQEMMDKLLAAEKSKTEAHRENKSDMQEILKAAVSSVSESRRCVCGAINPRTSAFCGACGNKI